MIDLILGNTIIPQRIAAAATPGGTGALRQGLELIKIAKSKNLLLSEATLFNYHAVFQQIIKMIGGKKKIEFLQSNFNIPQVKLLKEINLTKSDCFMDMSPYAAALIRLYLDNNNLILLD